jgi:hypothetical protein
MAERVPVVVTQPWVMGTVLMVDEEEAEIWRAVEGMVMAPEGVIIRVAETPRDKAYLYQCYTAKEVMKETKESAAEEVPVVVLRPWTPWTVLEEDEEEVKEGETWEDTREEAAWEEAELWEDAEELPGAAVDSQELPRAAVDSQELSGAAMDTGEEPVVVGPEVWGRHRGGPTVWGRLSVWDPGVREPGEDPGGEEPVVVGPEVWGRHYEGLAGWGRHYGGPAVWGRVSLVPAVWR